jgi:hypothetical protein
MFSKFIAPIRLPPSTFPNLIAETGDKIELAGRTGHRILLVIEKTNEPIGGANVPSEELRHDRDN